MLECQAKNYKQAIMSHKMQKLKENTENIQIHKISEYYSKDS